MPTADKPTEGAQTTTLGTFERVELRVAWNHEALSFTPWLAEPDNLRLLGQATNLRLETVGMEQPVGPFRADILCREVDSGRLVLIENQIEGTDHNHLGQVLTYAAGLDARTIIWIAKEFTPQHRAALDWLNRNTNDDLSFFAVEIELWRIENSPPAPRFQLVAWPNGWSREVKKYRDQEVLDPERAATYRTLWTEVSRILVTRGADLPLHPTGLHWVRLDTGIDGFRRILSYSFPPRTAKLYLLLDAAAEMPRFQATRQLAFATHPPALAEVEWVEDEREGSGYGLVTRRFSGAPGSDAEAIAAWVQPLAEAAQALVREALGKLPGSRE